MKNDDLLRNLREILVDLIQYELPPSLWDQVERSVMAITNALAVSGWPVITTETAALESVAPNRARPLGGSVSRPVSERLRERIYILIHAVDQKRGERDGRAKPANARRAD